MSLQEDKEFVCSVDPGSRNFSFLIEELDLKELKKLSCPPKNKRFSKIEDFVQAGKKKKRGEDLEPSKEYNEFLEKFWHCGRTVYCKNSDITGGVKGKGKTELTQEDLVRLMDLLDEHKEYFDKCSTIIIEKQMSFGKAKTNPIAIIIEHFVSSYFIIKYGCAKKIISYPAYNKTQILGCPGGLDKPKRKKWAIQKADEIWSLRGDMNSVENLAKAKKRDDISDALILSLSWAILEYF
jgi:hypothetical protein